MEKSPSCFPPGAVFAGDAGVEQASIVPRNSDTSVTRVALPPLSNDLHEGLSLRCGAEGVAITISVGFECPSDALPLYFETPLRVCSHSLCGGWIMLIGQDVEEIDACAQP